FFFSCSCETRDSKEQIPKYASLSDSTEYVGMQTCRQCHSDIYNTYINTGMGQSFDYATGKKSSADFSGDALVRDIHKNFLYHTELKGDSLFLKEFRMSGGDTVYQSNRKLDYIVGSGQHTNSHLWLSGQYLYQAPVTFYTQKGIWDLPPGFEGGFNSRFGRKIELECISCHNGLPKIVPGSQNKYELIPNGIDCERCHGPGKKHVDDKLKGIRIDTSKYIDYSIVNPSKLPIDLQLDVCQRCHIQGNAVLNEGKTFLDFRPGMKLSDVMNVFMPVYKGQENEHIMASHSERMKMSECYKVSIQSTHTNPKDNELKPYKSAMTCITCHNPHVSVKVTGFDNYNNACNSCHGGAVAQGLKNHSVLCSMPEKDRLAAGNNCVSCHMKKNTTIDIPHVSSTDHFIRKPVNEKEKESIREFLALVCINNPNADSIATGKAYLSYFEKFVSNKVYLDSAERYLIKPVMRMPEAYIHLLVRLYFLKNEYLKVKELRRFADKYLARAKGPDVSNEHAWCAYRLGESFYKSGDLINSKMYFSLAVELAPFIPEFRNKFASVLHDAGKTEESIKQYQIIIRENPEYISSYTSLGFILLSEKSDAAKAEELFNSALKLDPDNVPALLNMAGLKLYSGRKAEALALLGRVLQIDPKNSEASALKNKLKNN
ncbi:MAG: hypothetical protein DWQ48_06860, partial [Bacteroidetes bacterium]